MRPPCVVPDCEQPQKSGDYCNKHIKRLRANGSLDPLPRPSPTERFWAKVDKGDGTGCWLWTASTARGYGQFSVNGRGATMPAAHRWLWEQINGPRPKGMDLDHLCRTPACVRPDHLELVTHKENCLRGVGSPAVNATKTHCAAGHPFDESNTIRTKRGRACRACTRAWDRVSKARKKAS